MAHLRPHDIAVALQLALTPGATFRMLGHETGLSHGEAQNAVRRLVTAGLVRADDRSVRRRPLLDFLVSGVPHAYAAEPGAQARGVPTAHGAPPFASEFDGGETLVWPSAEGLARGSSLEPLTPTATVIASRNQRLYHMLAAVDMLRIGRARERQRARSFLEQALVEPDETPS